MTPEEQKSEAQEIAVDVDIDHRNPIRIQIKEYKEKMRCDIRHHYYDAAGDLLPTKNGLNILLSDVPGLVDTLIAAYSESTFKLGLVEKQS